MGFVEIERKPGGGRKGPPAAFSITKKGIGALRVNAAGVEFIREKGIELFPGDMVKLFHDPETRKLAIKKSPEGKFRLSKNANKDKTLRITSKDLTAILKEAAVYDVIASEEYDLVLIPK